MRIYFLEWEAYMSMRVLETNVIAPQIEGSQC